VSKKLYLDRDGQALRQYFFLTDQPVWYTVELSLDRPTEAHIKDLAKQFFTMQSLLSDLHEAIRAGRPTTEILNQIKELACPTPTASPEPTAASSGKRRSKRGSAAASSGSSPEASPTET
jgi:hypothetical protein